jgi:MscS family membrane protein
MHKRVYGQAIWQWTGLVLTVIVGLLVMLLAFWLGRVRALPQRQTNLFRYWLFFVFPLAALLVPQAVKNFVGDQLVVSGKTLATVDFCADVVFLLTLVMVIMAMANRIAAAIISSPRIQPKGIDAQFIRLAFRVAGMVAAVMIFIEGGKYLGISLSTVLAGAGVGGLAVALGAQDTLKNLFGSMMIVLDKPYRVGERIVFKGYDGVVEEIGLRSTRLRLLTGHQVTVPNDEMGRCDIENIGRRPHIRRIADLAIPLDTPTEKIELALRIVRELLQNHEGMDAAFPPRAYFNEYNRDSLNLRIIYWYHPPNYWDFMAFSERLNLQIKRQLEAADISFALPTTTTHLAASENTSVVINSPRIAESDTPTKE